MTRTWQLVLIVIGAFTGLLLFALPLQLYFDVTTALESQTALFSDQFLVLNKEVTEMHALGAKPRTFSDAEIAELQSQSGVESVAKFTANDFRAWAVADFGGGQVIKTDLFFEAVPDEFLDEKPAGWNWHPKDPDIPIVVPADYLALYNFGFAPGQDLPQISQNLAQLSVFKIELSGGGNYATYEGRIAGFSDRINTILAPQKFIDWANKQFKTATDTEAKGASRIIIKASDPSTLEKVMMEKGYETNQEAMKAGKTQAVAKSILSITLMVAFVIILLSLGSFLQFSDLLIARSDNEIKTLHYLGYTESSITSILFRQVLGLVAWSALAAMIASAALRLLVHRTIPALLADASPIPSIYAIIGFVMLVLGYLTISYFNLRRQVRRMNTPF